MAGENDMSDEALERFIEMMTDATRAGESNIEAQIQLYLEETKLGKAMVKTTKATGEVTKGFKDSAKAVGGSTGNFNDLTGAVTGTIKAVTGLLSSIPIIGGIVSGLGDAAAELTEFAIGQTQAGFDSFQKLSQAGMMGVEGITGLGDSLEKAGVPLATYTRLLEKNAEDMAYFGGSALKGGADFTKVIGSMQTGEDMRLRSLGFSLEEIGDTVVNFQKRSQRLGFSQEMSTAQLQDATSKYGKELDLIAKLTGKQRSEIEKERDTMMADDQFRAMMNQMPKMTDEAKAQMMDSLNAMGPEMKNGIKQIMASGAIVGEDAKKLAIQGMGADILAMRKSFKSGEMGVAEFIQKVQESSKKHEMTFNDLTAITGQSVGIRQAELSDMANKRALTKKEAAELKAIQDKQADGSDANTRRLTESMIELQKATAHVNRLFLSTPLASKTIGLFTEALTSSIGIITEAFGTGEQSKSVASKGFTTDRDLSNEQTQSMAWKTERALQDKQDTLEARKAQGLDAGSLPAEIAQLKKEFEHYNKQVNKGRDLGDLIDKLEDKLDEAGTKSERDVITAELKQAKVDRQNFYRLDQLKRKATMSGHELKNQQAEVGSTIAEATGKKDKAWYDFTPKDTGTDIADEEAELAEIKTKHTNLVEEIKAINKSLYDTDSPSVTDAKKYTGTVNRDAPSQTKESEKLLVEQAAHNARMEKYEQQKLRYMKDQLDTAQKTEKNTNAG